MITYRRKPKCQVAKGDLAELLAPFEASFSTRVHQNACIGFFHRFFLDSKNSYGLAFSGRN